MCKDTKDRTKRSSDVGEIEIFVMLHIILPEKEKECWQECSEIVVPVYVLRGHEADITKHLMQQHCGEYSKEHAEQF